jgi:hypothetical protein
MRLYNEDKTKIDALEAEMSKKNDDGHFMAEPFQHLRPNPAGQWQYDWSIENWGTKWEARIDYETTDQWETGEVFIEFATAWSAPMPIIETVVKKYPKLLFIFTCWEESYEFWAEYHGKAGELLLIYDGEFRGCDDYKQFGLTHHFCYRCECNYECAEIVEVGDEQQICWSCKEQEIATDKEVSQLDEQLWEGEIVNGTKALSH